MRRRWPVARTAIHGAGNLNAPKLSDHPEKAAKLEALGTRLFGNPISRDQQKLRVKDPDPRGGAILLRLRADGDFECELTRNGAIGVGEAALIAYAKSFNGNGAKGPNGGAHGSAVNGSGAHDATAEPAPEEAIAADAGYPNAPPRDPKINRVLDTTLLALSLAKTDPKKLQAITTAAKLLHRFGKTTDAIEVQDLINESAIYTHNLASEDVQAAWVKGIDRANHLLRTKPSVPMMVRHRSPESLALRA
jgi:hypothetical protein